MEYDFGFIKRSDIFIGDLRMVIGIDKEYIDILKNCSSFRNSNIIACKTVPAKNNAVLIKVDNEHFIDLDSIKSKNDLKTINELLQTESFDNNVFLTLDIKEPFIGKLYISSLKVYGNGKGLTDIKRLKLFKEKLVDY